MVHINIKKKPFIDKEECAKFCQITLEEDNFEFENTIDAACDLVINTSGLLFSQSIIECKGYSRKFLWPFFPVNKILEFKINGKDETPEIKPMSFDDLTSISVVYESSGELSNLVKQCIYTLVFQMYIRKTLPNDWINLIKSFMKDIILVQK